MPKLYQPLICARCDLKFGIHKNHYDPKNRHLCPICGSDNIVTSEDLKPPKKFRPQKKRMPILIDERL